MILLTIVIPTFNRANLLLSTLNGLKAQLGNDLIKKIEIVVSDNASPDDTQVVLENWILKNPDVQIIYSRNIENLGFDKNCDVGARKANGKYIWFMSDDDELVPSAVQKVFHALSENSEVVFAFVNYSLMTPGYDEYFQYRFTDNVQLSPDEFIIKTKFGFSFISACIFDKEIWCKLKLDNYIGSYWMQLYAARDAILFGNSLIIAEPLIRMRREGLHESRRERKSATRKIDLFMEYHLSFLDFLETFKNSKYLPSTYEEIKELGWNDNLGQILSLKLTSDKYSTEEIGIILNRMKKFFSSRILFWALHVPMLILPPIASKIYFSLKLKYISLKKCLKPYVVNTSFYKAIKQ